MCSIVSKEQLLSEKYNPEAIATVMIPSFYLRHLMYLIKLNRKKYTHTIVDVYMVMHDQTVDFDFAIFFPLAIQHILVSIYS